MIERATEGTNAILGFQVKKRITKSNRPKFGAQNAARSSRHLGMNIPKIGGK